MPIKPKLLCIPRPILMISMKYGSGEIIARGTEEIGMKRGLINITGNFTKIVRIIVLTGISLGDADKINEKLEKTSAAIIIPREIIMKFIDPYNPKKNPPRSRGIVEKRLPKMNELHIFPIKMVLTEIGQVINRSSVICLVSHGKTTGPIEVEVKKTIIAISPETMYTGMIFLQIVKARKSIH